jgi:hypothetical protein
MLKTIKKYVTKDNAKYAGSLLVAVGTGYALATVTTYFANKFGVSPEAIAISAYGAKTVGFMGGNVVAYKLFQRRKDNVGEHLKSLTRSNSLAVVIDAPLKVGTHFALMSNGVNDVAAMYIAYLSVATIPAGFKLWRDIRNGVVTTNTDSIDALLEPANDDEDLAKIAQTGA